MSERDDIITKAFARFLTGFCLSKALLEDYAKVISKIENIPEQDVISRVNLRTDEIFQEVLKKQAEESDIEYKG